MTLDALDHATDLVSADARTRDVALFRSAEDVLRSLETHYLPPRAPCMLDSLRGQTLEALRDRIGGESPQNQAFARQFGEYRNVVLLHEETCARRLDVLRGTAQTLERLVAGARDPDRLRGMLTTLAEFVAARWRVDLPLGPVDRGWSLRVSRRYDLLPPTWRSL